MTVSAPGATADDAPDAGLPGDFLFLVSPLLLLDSDAFDEVRALALSPLSEPVFSINLLLVST